MKKGTNRVIWDIGPTDELVKHSSMADRGSRSLSLFHKRPKFNESEYASFVYPSVLTIHCKNQANVRSGIVMKYCTDCESLIRIKLLFNLYYK